MKKLAYLFPFLLLFGCSSDNSKIYFRIKNNMGVPIRTEMGRTILKAASGYSIFSKSFKTKFPEIGNGQVTKYKKTKGMWWGYAPVEVFYDGTDLDGQKRRRGNDEDIMEAIKTLNLQLVEDSMPIPYSDRTMTKERLPDGKYTLTIEGFHPKFGTSVLVSITKD